jgi:SAM-dependent methyltransferase
MRARTPSVPSFPPPPPPVGGKVSRASSPSFPTTTIKTAIPPEHIPGPSKPRPIVIVPQASPLAPPPVTDAASAAARKRARPWWEELFNDDFVRTMAKITDAQIATEVDFIEESLGLDKGAMVLDLACGTGRHAIELTRRGYQVVGFDLSLAMLAKAADEAQERQQKLNFVQGDMREMTFDGTFDGVYCWATSFGFFEEEKNAAVIANVHRALKPGGQVLLDVVNRDFVAQQCPSLVWFEGDGCVCMDDMTIDWITSRMKVKRTLMMDDGRSREIEYSIRLYALHELGKLLHDNGFRVAQVSGRVATPGVFFGANSPRTLILAEKK